jgi:hypothetical protein
MKRKNDKLGFTADSIIGDLERNAKAKWIPIRDLEQEGYADEYIVFLVRKSEWDKLKEMIRDL